METKNFGGLTTEKGNERWTAGIVASKFFTAEMQTCLNNTRWDSSPLQCPECDHQDITLPRVLLVQSDWLSSELRHHFQQCNIQCMQHWHNEVFNGVRTPQWRRKTSTRDVALIFDMNSSRLGCHAGWSGGRCTLGNETYISAEFSLPTGATFLLVWWHMSSMSTYPEHSGHGSIKHHWIFWSTSVCPQDWE